MKFTLFKKIAFEVSNPIALIECYCFQNDFYSNYNLINNRQIEDVNKIGARINKKSLQQCKNIINRTKDLPIFRYNLNGLIALRNKKIL